MLWQSLRNLFHDTEEVASVFKPEWVEMLVRTVPLYSVLPDELRLRLNERIARFIGSTRFEGCNDLDLTEEMILTIAAQACLLVIHREGEPYPQLKTVYLYPTTFKSIQKSRDAIGVVTEGEVSRLGESWAMGTVILAWDSVEQGARNIYDGHNVTFHEFSHQLDYEDGDADGAPNLTSRQSYRSWAKVFGDNYADFHDLLERGKKTLIDPYGATNPAEFFAVATETFFEKPKQLFKKRPELYAELSGYYGLDPRSW